jgi:hypothetical protein
MKTAKLFYYKYLLQRFILYYIILKPLVFRQPSNHSNLRLVLYSYAMYCKRQISQISTMQETFIAFLYLLLDYDPLEKFQIPKHCF